MEVLADIDVEPWTDDRARAWWDGSKDAIAAHLSGKRSGLESRGPVTLALLGARETQAA